MRTGTSVGIAVFGPDSPDAETLLSHADVALYRAKSEGRRTYWHKADVVTRAAGPRIGLIQAIAFTDAFSRSLKSPLPARSGHVLRQMPDVGYSGRPAKLKASDKRVARAAGIASALQNPCVLNLGSRANT